MQIRDRFSISAKQLISSYRFSQQTSRLLAADVAWLEEHPNQEIPLGRRTGIGSQTALRHLVAPSPWLPQGIDNLR
jgi:hypothetical protein